MTSDHRPPRQSAIDLLVAGCGSPSAAVEALLFASHDGETISNLAIALGRSVQETRDAINELERELRDRDRGILIQRRGEIIQLVTAPEFGPSIARLLGLERTIRLSGAALETLALVAYRQPITRSEIEAVRGVDSGSVVATLVARELIEPAGRRSTAGAPTEFVTTGEFLRLFGLASLDELPTGETETTDSIPGASG